MMKPLIQFRKATPLLATVLPLLLACFAMRSAPNVFGVVPPPDGGYPNFTTAEGQNALFSLTSGAANTAIGWSSLFGNTNGSFNTALGAGTLLSNGSGNSNTAIGTATLLFNTTGSGNSAFGVGALENNTASENTAVGSNALSSNTTGGTVETVLSTDLGPNTAVGAQALHSNTTASANTALGFQALGSVTTGFDTGSGDTHIGASTAVGFQALANATDNGVLANSAFGYQALLANTTGVRNTAIGTLALANSTSGNDNIAIGSSAGSAVTTAGSVICIGTGGQNINASCFIGHIYGNPQPIVGIDPDSVTVTSAGRLGRGNVSSRRYKHDIQPMDKASEAIYALKPVSFRYHKEYDATQTLSFGLIAEEVSEVYPDLVGRNPEGQPESVRYEQINAMLLNEFLKEHRKNEKQASTIARLEQRIEALTAGLQKVSAQLDAANGAAGMRSDIDGSSREADMSE